MIELLDRVLHCGWCFSGTCALGVGAYIFLNSLWVDGFNTVVRLASLRAKRKASKAVENLGDENGGERN